MIYADNAATTKLDRDAFEAMCPFLLERYGNSSQPYSFAYDARKAMESARATIAKCIGADPEEIYFTSCGTESNNWVIKMAAGDTGGIMTSVIEHHAVLNACAMLQKQGRSILYAPVSRTGEIDINYVEERITKDIRLLSVMYANNEIGTIQPVEQLAELAHKHQCLYHTDAVQAVGHINIDVHALGIDLLSASAHKFNGPKGIGFLYIRKGTNISPYMDGGSQERGLRAGTENVAFIVAMAVALEKNCKRIDKDETYLRQLESLLIKKLNMANLDFLVNGSTHKIPGNINLSFADMQGEMILHRMDLQGICISTGSACDSKHTQVSHVMKAVGIPKKYAEGTIRISLSKDNTNKEVEKIADSIIEIIKSTNKL